MDFEVFDSIETLFIAGYLNTLNQPVLVSLNSTDLTVTNQLTSLANYYTS